jgi:hypothetical protein
VPHRCVYPGSAPEDIDEVVAGFFDLQTTAVALNPGFEEQFNADNQTRTLHDLVQSLHRSASERSQCRTQRDFRWVER